MLESGKSLHVMNIKRKECHLYCIWYILHTAYDTILFPFRRSADLTFDSLIKCCGSKRLRRCILEYERCATLLSYEGLWTHFIGGDDWCSEYSNSWTSLKVVCHCSCMLVTRSRLHVMLEGWFELLLLSSIQFIIFSRTAYQTVSSSILYLCSALLAVSWSKFLSSLQIR